MRPDDSPGDPTEQPDDHDLTLEALKERGNAVMAESHRIAVRMQEHLAALREGERYMSAQWTRRRSRTSKPERS